MARSETGWRGWGSLARAQGIGVSVAPVTMTCAPIDAGRLLHAMAYSAGLIVGSQPGDALGIDVMLW